MTAQADIGEESHLGFLQSDKKEEERGPKWITRNPIDGMSIPVCSTAFPRATALAIERWNTALGFTAFTVSKNCNTAESLWEAENGIVSLTVSMGVRVGSMFGSRTEIVTGMVCPYQSSRACAGFDRMHYGDGLSKDTDQWRSYHGRAQIIMSPRFASTMSVKSMSHPIPVATSFMT